MKNLVVGDLEDVLHRLVRNTGALEHIRRVLHQPHQSERLLRGLRLGFIGRRCRNRPGRVARGVEWIRSRRRICRGA